MSNLRLFIALNFSKEIIQSILKLIKNMQQYFPPGNLRWVKPENIHLTLKFLGNVPSERLGALREAINETALHSLLPCVKIGGLGAFPTIDKPHSLYIGIHPDQNLLDLYKYLNLLLVSSGFPKGQDAFRPHITIARVPDKLSFQEVNAISTTIKTLEITELGFAWFKTMYLYKSDLARTGPTYTILQTANLKPHP